jgi:hypothetical protein
MRRRGRALLAAGVTATLARALRREQASQGEGGRQEQRGNRIRQSSQHLTLFSALATVSQMIEMLAPTTIRQRMLKLDRTFQACVPEDGDELFPNGIFEFNITRLLAFIDDHTDRFPVESVAVVEIPNFGGSTLNEKAIVAADLARPILMAEIAPGRYNVIDGHHRLANARRENVAVIPVRRFGCPEHAAFLTSDRAYEKYVEYWHSKLKEMSPALPRRRRDLKIEKR